MVKYKIGLEAEIFPRGTTTAFFYETIEKESLQKVIDFFGVEHIWIEVPETQVEDMLKLCSEFNLDLTCVVTDKTIEIAKKYKVRTVCDIKLTDKPDIIRVIKDKDVLTIFSDNGIVKPNKELYKHDSWFEI